MTALLPFTPWSAVDVARWLIAASDTPDVALTDARACQQPAPGGAMRITIEKTDKLVTLNGVPARVWEGVTAGGVACHLFVTRVAVASDADVSEFERELQETRAPSADVDVIPTHLVL